MVQKNMFLESEKEFNNINEKEYDKRMILQQLENLIKYGSKRGKNNGKGLLKEQQIVLQEYLEELLVNGRINSPMTIKNNIGTLYRFGITINNPFSLITTKDIKGYSLTLSKTTSSSNSISVQLVIIKKFFNWLKKNGECLAEVEWIKRSSKHNKILNEDGLITQTEIKAMAQIGDRRDACFLMVLYEGALRIGEALNIKLSDIFWNDDNTVHIIVDGKTGKRKLIFIDSVPYIKAWINEHPYRNNPNSPLIINYCAQFGRQIKSVGGWQIIKKLAKRAGITKRVYPHKLRHSRLNYLAKYYNFNERDLRKFAGWTGTSAMPNTYIHYDMDAVDDKIKGVKGIGGDNTLDEQRLKQELILKEIKCPNCNSINPSTNVICDKCNQPFEIKRKELADDKLNELFGDDEFKELVKGFLKKKAMEVK